MPERDDHGRFRAKSTSIEPVKAGVAASSAASGLGGGRLSLDDAFSSFGAMPFILQPPSSFDSSWSNMRLSDAMLDTLPAETVLGMLVDLSPDISRGFWDFLRLFNPANAAVCLKLDKEEPDEKAQPLLDDFLTTLDRKHGSRNVVFNRLGAAGFMRGAFLTELVLDLAGRTPLDLATPDPATIRFRRQVDPVEGPYWQMLQQHAGQIVLLDKPTIRYVPIDPMPGNPYGRSLCAPAVFVSLFLLGFLRDIRRVIAQQGYPRQDIKVILEKLSGQLTQFQKQDPNSLREFAQKTIAEISAAFAALQPDETFVHSDAIEIGHPTGSVDNASLGAVEPLMRMLERMAIKSLKSMPILSGMADGTTEVNANRQWEIQASSMRNMQLLCSNMLSSQLTLALQAQGVNTRVKFTFGEIRSSEELRDEQTMLVRLKNATAAYQLGYWSQEQASEHAIKDKPALSKPLEIPALYSTSNGSAATLPDPGVNKGVEPIIREVPLLETSA